MAAKAKATKKPTQLDRIEKTIGGQRNLAHVDAAQMTHVENALYGNGREGLISRTARIETSLEAAAANTARNSEGITKLLTATEELKASIEVHHKSPHLSILMTKAKFWVAVFGSLLGFNLLSRYIPGAITLLFAWLGLPGVHIPLE